MTKQYLLLCNGDEARIKFEQVIKGVHFLEVQGVNSNNLFNVLVTPITTPTTTTTKEEEAPTSTNA